MRSLALLLLLPGCLGVISHSEDGGTWPCLVEQEALVWTEPGIWGNRSADVAGLPVDEPDPWDAFHADPAWRVISLEIDRHFGFTVMDTPRGVTMFASVAGPLDERAAWMVANGTWNATRERLIEDMGEGNAGHFVGQTEVTPDPDRWWRHAMPELQDSWPGRLVAQQGNWSLRGQVPTAELADGRLIDAGDRVQTPFDWIDAVNETALDQVRTRLPDASFIDVGFFVIGGCTDWATSVYVPLDEAHRLPDEIGSFT